ncbi:MAG: ubiquinone/menaquinone biosynthesis C-methylase UbiE [Paracoccaceae bacterium]|jgi:ubiquinone/menaquinone biosynthesis C-methylase UbiE
MTKWNLKLGYFHANERSQFFEENVIFVAQEIIRGFIMAEKNTFNLSSSAADSYERQKVPAIFAPMAEATLDAISLPLRASILDVACGTGAVARAVGSRIDEPSRITGADLNPAMIEVARQNTPDGNHEYEFVVASADSMPFEDAKFDLLFCQHGLQFFPDKPAALTEMRRVMRKGGKLVLTCWAGIPPMFQVVQDVLGRHIGEAAASSAVAPFVWNDSAHISDLITEAGFDCSTPSALAVDRTMSASPEAMREEILATPNEPALRAAGDEVINRIVSEISEGVAQYKEGQKLCMPQTAHLFQARAA